VSWPEDSRKFAGARREAISLTRVWPEIADALAPDDRDLAERALVAPLVKARGEDLGPALASEPTASWFAIVDGTVLKETTLATRSALELLGPGDLLAPPVGATPQLESRAVSRYLALGEVSIAGVGVSFTRVAARFPQILDFLNARLAEQAHGASMHLAMLHLPRAEDRIIALFTDLAERFGRVTTDAILIDLPLTHDLIGRLVASRRPTVSLALTALDDQGLLGKHDDKRWRLTIEQT
jgi:CRP-like cAMP-binding protein